jgi:hypothetical protein
MMIIKIPRAITNPQISQSLKEGLNETALEIKPVRIEILPNGPAIVNGSFVITHENGIKMKMANMVSFCTCGKSANQPFCDGSHHM